MGIPDVCLHPFLNASRGIERKGSPLVHASDCCLHARSSPAPVCMPAQPQLPAYCQRLPTSVKGLGAVLRRLRVPAVQPSVAILRAQDSQVCDVINPEIEYTPFNKGGAWSALLYVPRWCGCSIRMALVQSDETAASVQKTCPSIAMQFPLICASLSHSTPPPATALSTLIMSASAEPADATATGDVRKIQCFCGACSVAVSGDPVAGMRSLNSQPPGGSVLPLLALSCMHLTTLDLSRRPYALSPQP